MLAVDYSYLTSWFKSCTLIQPSHTKERFLSKSIQQNSVSIPLAHHKRLKNETKTHFIPLTTISTALTNGCAVICASISKHPICGNHIHHRFCSYISFLFHSEKFLLYVPPLQSIKKPGAPYSSKQHTK